RYPCQRARAGLLRIDASPLEAWIPICLYSTSRPGVEGTLPAASRHFTKPDGPFQENAKRPDGTAVTAFSRIITGLEIVRSSERSQLMGSCIFKNHAFHLILEMEFPLFQFHLFHLFVFCEVRTGREFLEFSL